MPPRHLYILLLSFLFIDWHNVTARKSVTHRAASTQLQGARRSGTANEQTGGPHLREGWSAPQSTLHTTRTPARRAALRHAHAPSEGGGGHGAETLTFTFLKRTAA